MKDINLKELEERVNNEGITIMSGWMEKTESDSGDNREVLDAVMAKLQSIILKEYGYENIRITDYRNRIYICLLGDSIGRYGEGPCGIQVKVKKTVDKEKSDWKATYYKFISIEIEDTRVWDPYNKVNVQVNTLKEYMAARINEQRYAKEYKQSKLDNFRKKLQDNGIDLKLMLELEQEYHNLEFEHKVELAKEVDPDKYYLYY